MLFLQRSFNRVLQLQESTAKLGNSKAEFYDNKAINKVKKLVPTRILCYECEYRTLFGIQSMTSSDISEMQKGADTIFVGNLNEQQYEVCSQTYCILWYDKVKRVEN